MRTGTAVLLCFLVWFGWGRWQDHRKAELVEQRQNLEGYGWCMKTVPACTVDDGACMARTKPARDECAREWSGE